MYERLALIACLLCLIGCGDAPEPTGIPTNETRTSAGGQPRVALIMKSLANEFFSTMAAGAEAHQAKNREQYQLVVNGIKDERDISRQVALVDEMVASGVDAIVIAPADSKALIPALRKAQQKGVVIVNIDNRLDATVLKQENITVPFVGPDNKTGARSVGDYLATKLDRGSSVLVLEGIRTSFNGQQRREGFKDAMDEAGILIADSQSAEWEMSKANTIASSMLSEHPDATGILAANDSMALGAIAAVKSAGRTDDILIVGFDNISAVQEAIKEGKILATADQHGGSLAVFGIEAALQMLADSDSIPQDVETPVDLITAETLQR
ncbi:MAG: sugar ABC transporter substrate-binding protein [Pirellulales bacterium]|nr:sugar ABC transporter substrate-binding protein [Pirellulales bacterium]